MIGIYFLVTLSFFSLDTFAQPLSIHQQTQLAESVQLYQNQQYQDTLKRLCIDFKENLQITEFTQAQWFYFTGKNPSYHRKKEHCPTTWIADHEGMCPENPVENVSWNEVQKLIQQFNTQQNEFHYRLPYAIEFEAAAELPTSLKLESRGKDTENAHQISWNYFNSGDHTHEVATRKPNAAGYYDLAGNVWEWLQDSIQNTESKNHYSEALFRGGSALYFVEFLDPQLRIFLFHTNVKQIDIGFRLARQRVIAY